MLRIRKGATCEVDPSAEETLKNFNKGLYDDVAFSENPRLTDNLKFIIEKYNGLFIQRLFLKCNSESCIRFWLESGYAQLPKNPLAIALGMHNNIFVVRFLKEKGVYDNLSRDEKNEILLRSQNFMDEASKYGEGSRFLRQEFTKQAPKLVM